MSGDDFARRYVATLQRHLEQRDETSLTAAYELGRSAVREGSSVLELAVAHHDGLGRALDARGSSATDARSLVDRAGEFFCEALAAFDMVQRVLYETREAAAAERRQAATLRRLSTFLADASIAVDAGGSVEEMLQLVAEHAREVIGANRCIARLSLERDGERVRHVARAGEDEEHGDPAAGPRGDLETLYTAVAPRGRSVRLTGAELVAHPGFRALDLGEGQPPRGWLAASLTTLDGRDLGVVQLFDKDDGDFTELDEEVLVQLVQMASAAVERADLYRR
jgi:GAF domain-containing protein